ncbi:MAG: ATP synthase F1 subunit delta [FCB group bacterium]|nr:ATP synthase F1 subunit delta [FCB group bacterium]
MSLQRNLRQYALSLYSAAAEAGQVRETERRLDAILKMYKAIPAFKQLLLTKRVDPEVKLKILKTVLASYVSALETDLITVLVKEGLLDKLAVIIKGYKRLADADPSSVNVTIFMSQESDKESLADITKRLEKILNKQVFAKTVEDKTLIGGAKFRIGNTIVDGSIERRLEKLRESLIRA